MSKKITKQKLKEWEDHCNKVLFNSSMNAKGKLDEIKETTKPQNHTLWKKET